MAPVNDGAPGLTDILIPDVPEDVVAAIDIKAQRLGLTRSDYLRRALTRERDARIAHVSTADLARFANSFAALDDPDVMSRAWR
jgi:Ribbon-helix-helix protein, copG family